MAADESQDDKTQSFVVLTSGTVVLHYKVLEKIGSGGMGEVYLALDTKLNRKVALKFLPPHLCQDEDCRKRFIREAQAAARLDHSNIAAIHEVGEYQSRPFYSMQLVEGQSLKEVIGEKDLPIDRILEIGIQVCEGLQATHDKGIIHRDIKPSNILLDEHGRVRIVDFGLAAIRGSEHLTKTGSTLGTIGYMSPEQVRGEEIDHRSDLFSLGAVLYELITKQSPFKRDSEAATMKAVCDDTPHPVARYRANVLDGLQAIVDKSLEKDVKTRYQTASGVLADLMRLMRLLDSGESTVSVSTVGRRSSRVWWIAAAAVVVVVPAGFYFLEYGRQSVQRSSPQFRKITHTGDIGLSDLSRDGSLIAYDRTLDDRSTKIYVQDVDGGDAVDVFDVGQDTLYSLWWLPSGKELLLDIANSSGRAVYLIPRLGGDRRKFDFSGAQSGGCGVSPDGTRCVTIIDGNRLLYLDLSTGDTSSVSLEPKPELALFITWIPPGDRILIGAITAEEGIGLYSVRPDGTDLRLIGRGLLYACWSGDDKAIYATKSGFAHNPLSRISVDPKTGVAMGQPEILLSGLKMSGLAASDGGRMLLFKRRDPISNLWKVSLAPSESISSARFEQLTSETSLYEFPRVSPGGDLIAFTGAIDRGRQGFVLLADGGVPRQVTHTSLMNVLLDWSPDGNQLAAISLEDFDSANLSLRLIPIEGGKPITVCRLPIGTCDGGGFCSWSREGRIVMTDGECSRLWIIDPQSGHIEKVPQSGPEGKMYVPHVSSRGDRVALYWEGKPDKADGIWTISLVDYSETLITSQSARVFGWGPDDEWIYVWRSIENSNRIEIGRVNAGSQAVEWLVATDQDINPEPSSIDLSPDATWAVFADRQRQNDLWLVENFDPYTD